MGRGILNGFINSLDAAAAKLPDNRMQSNDTKYTLADALKSALAVFYFQHPSLLSFQTALKRRSKRDNLETLFGVKKVPSSDQIRNIIDDIDPSALEEMLDYGLRVAKKESVYARYRVLDGEIPLSCDATWYFSSQEVSCEHCLTMTSEKKDGTKVTTYYHDVLAFVITKYDSNIVLPLPPEFIRNEDGTEKQDCERNAFHRYFARYAPKLNEMRAIIIADALYACHSICSAIDKHGLSFIFVCKDEGHPWYPQPSPEGEVPLLIVGQTGEDAPYETYEKREWNGRNHLIHRYKWLNKIENRADPDFMHVDYLDYEVWNEETGKSLYHNSWNPQPSPEGDVPLLITNKTISRDNVVELAKVARGRWKIENEHNNVLKHRGYNLKHNFGHGKNHAAELFCLLNMVAFLIHGLQTLADEDYRKARATFSSRQEFFGAMRHEISFHLYLSWEQLLSLLADTAPDG